LSILPHYLRLGRALIAALTLATMLANSQRAFAWKPKTHAHLAEVAYRDAVDDGLVTIYATDYQRGVIRRFRGNNNKVTIGTYRVYPPMLEALRKYPAHFRAGVLGPDAYPDIATGQQIIHPAGQRSNGETEADLNRGGPGPDPLLAHLWAKAYSRPSYLSASAERHHVSASLESRVMRAPSTDSSVDIYGRIRIIGSCGT
jgi:hypothetical protein